MLLRPPSELTQMQEKWEYKRQEESQSYRQNHRHNNWKSDEIPSDLGRFLGTHNFFADGYIRSTCYV